MGLHFSITDMVKAADNFVDANLKAGAKAVQKGSHVVGGALNGVGLHGAAQSVNGWGDGVADEAGLKVGERGLDETDDPKELVHGDAKKINESAAHLRKFHDAFEKTGTGLARLDHEHWTGAAAEAFQKAFNPQPKQWLAAADACGKAAAALEAYAHTVVWAQGEAAEASRLWKAAKKKYDSAVKATLQAALTYDLQVKAYNATPADQRPTSPPAKPGEFTNPAEADFHRAEEKLDAARTQRDSAARTAAAAISTATRSAPPRPSDMEILKANIKDGLTAAPVSVFHFGGGVVKSGTDLIKLGRSLNFLDPYNLSHPAQYLQGLSTTTAGLIQAGDHPADLVTGLVGSGWGSDPSEATGRLGGNLLLGGGTGGGAAGARPRPSPSARPRPLPGARPKRRPGTRHRRRRRKPPRRRPDRQLRSCLCPPASTASRRAGVSNPHHLPEPPARASRAPSVSRRRRSPILISRLRRPSRSRSHRQQDPRSRSSGPKHPRCRPPTSTSWGRPRRHRLPMRRSRRTPRRSTAMRKPRNTVPTTGTTTPLTSRRRSGRRSTTTPANRRPPMDRPTGS
nr:hypothetical protein [Streptomyces sp. NRRL S-495]